MCGKCGQRSEDHTKCESCGNPLPAEAPLMSGVPSSPTPRVPVRPLPSPGSPNITQLSKSFYGVVSGGRSTNAEAAMDPPARIARGNLLLPHNGAKLTVGKRQLPAKHHELNDPSECTLMDWLCRTSLMHHNVLTCRSCVQLYCPAMKMTRLTVPAREASTGWTASLRDLPTPPTRPRRRPAAE